MKQVINHGSVRDLERLGRKFVKKSGSKAFQNVIGAIDGTHIMINCPVKKHDDNNKLIIKNVIPFKYKLLTAMACLPTFLLASLAQCTTLEYFLIVLCTLKGSILQMDIIYLVTKATHAN